MNIIKKLLKLNSLLLLMAMLWSQPALARTDFEILVDFDEDGICDSEFFLGPYYFCSPHEGKPDNCPEVANPDQADVDGDGVGDACDTGDLPEDSDNDGIADCSGGQPLDLCPPPPVDLNCEGTSVQPGDDFDTPPLGGAAFPCNTSGLSQTQDLDGDGVGDACDPDVDGDGIANEEDCDCLDPNILGPAEGETCLEADPSQGGNPNNNAVSAGGCSIAAAAATAVPWTTLVLLVAALARFRISLK